ncbi:MAG: GGDEF domain-containing protein [Halioglobus sp.]
MRGLGGQLTITSESNWLRLKRHFTESFSGELVYRRRAYDVTHLDDALDKRRRNAYRYILLLLAVILLPIVTHNLYVKEFVPAAGALALLAILMVNILLLSMNREAFLSPPLVLLLSISLVLLSIYFGQNYSLYLLFPLLVALPILLKTRWAVVLGVLSGLVVSPLVFTHYDTTTATVIGMSMGLTWLVSAWLVFAVTEQSRRLKDMAITDALTGAYNRRYLDLQALKALELWRRYQRPASLLILDIDYFKRINDKHGHNAGDAALKSLVDVISQRIRAVDTLCRFGGDEFVLLLSETGIADSETVANKLRLAVQDVNLLPQMKLTISVGIAAVTSATDLDHWLNLADTALYLAKKKGRNRVELAESVVPQLMPIDKTVPTWR